VENLESIIDEIEEQMLDTDRDDPSRRSTLANVRRQAIAYRRYVVPQRDTLLGLAATSSPLLNTRDAAELRVAGETVARISEALEEMRDRAAVTQEEIRARHEESMGRTLYLLAIVATIALPLGLVTGLLGINVGGIPLAESHWGFLLVCSIMVGIAVVEMVFFRRRGWL
jgi:zinc transporter